MHRTATIILILLFILLNAGCTGVYSGDKTPASGTPEKIVVQAPLAPPTAPLFKMAGEVLPDGTPLEIIFYKSVEEATTRVVKGEADFSVLPVNVAAKLYNKGVDISLANVSTWGILYLVSLESDVREWTDLRGEELYVGARGSTPDVLTQYFLSRSGLKDGEAHLTYLDSPEIARMMINGLVKNAVLPEPMLTQVLMNRKEARVIRDFYSDWQQYEGESTALPQAGMVVLNQFARNYPGTVSEFHRAYAGALDWTVANPAEAAPLVEASASIPAPVFVQSMERTRLRFVPGSKARADVDVYLSRLLDFSPEMVGGKLPDEKFYLSD